MSQWVERAQSCWIHTTGRISGEAHRVTVWFAHSDGTLYVLSRHGDQADWVRNVRADGHVVASHGRESRQGSARVVTDAEEVMRGARAMFDKYSPRHRGLEGWGWLDGTVTVIAVDLI